MAVVVALLPLTHCSGQTTDDGLALRLRLGYSIGASTPIGIPATIRQLNRFSLSPNLVAALDATVPLKGQWALTTGLRFENKGMDATVSTKGYHMAMVKGGETLEGVYTGRVEQHVKAWMLTLPLQAVCSLSRQWQLRMGPYLSVLTAKTFEGNAYDGYLRKDDPTGQKIEMGHAPEERATYDFSADMRRLQVGIGVGADWLLTRCIGFSADFSWGLTGLMHSTFKIVEQTLYPVYGTLSLTYQLK